jgi:hypothetical protein
MNKAKCTCFWDMSSGGSKKMKWRRILIEAPEKDAVSVFYSRFGRNPNRITCTCCGSDYAITEYDTLDVALRQMKDFMEGDATKIITRETIKKSERSTDVPKEGFVWVGPQG